MIFAYPFYLKAIDSIMLSYGSASPFVNPESIPIALSYFHTAFNVSNVLIMIWFVPLLVKLAIKMVPSKGEDDEDFNLEFIGGGLLQTPEISLAEAQNEIIKFGKLNAKGVDKISELIEETTFKKQQKLLDKIKDYEEHSDLIEVKVAEFLMEVSKSPLTENASRKIQSYLSVVNHMESIGDIYYSMSKSVERMNDKDIKFDKTKHESLREMKELVKLSMDFMMSNIPMDENDIELDKAIELELVINKKRDKLRSKNFKNIEKGKVGLDSGLIYMDLISGYEKIADHTIDISKSLRGDHIDIEEEVHE